ncbi:MAG TPA: hypothetical protein VHZ28_01245 [Terracidiphilus sp.]|jgi:hypothetical protein|nr:hypothetical protein [Terracidiphilus sp.]
MPNWTSNQLIIEGDRAKVIAAAQFIKSDQRVIDFDKIIPMPDILKNTGSGNTTIDGRNVEVWFQDNSIEDHSERHKTERLFTEAELAKLAKTGFKNWYDWSCKNWGTKWNAYEATVENEFGGYLEIRFETAWCAPAPILAALRKKFPDLEVQLNYRNEDDSEFPNSL